MSNLQDHPNFGRIFTLYFFTLFALVITLMELCSSYFDNKGSEKVFYILFISVSEKVFYILFISVPVVTFLFVTIGLICLYNVKCPNCGQKTKTIQNTKIYMCQAYCPKCSITWNLGVHIDISSIDWFDLTRSISIHCSTNISQLSLASVLWSYFL